MKRYENPKIEDLLCKMNVFDIPWLQENKENFVNKKFKNIQVKRYRKCLADSLCFIYNEIIINIIKMNFYVTEKHNEGRKVFYFRKPLWKLVEKLSLKKLE